MFNVKNVVAAVTTLALSCAANASGDTVKIGVLADMSGPYASLAGKGSVIAAQMAIKDFGGRALGRPIELERAITKTRQTWGHRLRADGLIKNG